MLVKNININQRQHYIIFDVSIKKQKLIKTKICSLRNNTLFKIILIISIIFSFCYNAYAQPSLEANKVMGFFQNQQYDDAINYLTTLESSDSNNLQLLGYLAYANQMNNNNTVAEKYYKRMLNLDSNNISALQYISNDDNTDVQEALLLTRRLINLQPKKPSYQKNMGDLLRKIKQKDSALIYYKQAFDLAPTDYRYVAAFADILLDQKQPAKADSLLDAGLVKDSLNIAYLTLRIRSAYEAKDYKNVLTSGERLIRTGEKTLNPLSKLALSYYNLKMYKDCIRVCEYLIGQGFEVESVFYYQAKSYAKLNDYVKSNELLNVCLSIAISNTAEMYYYNLGENNEAIRQYKKAVSYYDSAYYLFKNPDMMYSSGRVSESELKNEKLARKYYAKYLEKARPQSADEKKVYEYVRNRMIKKKTDSN
jgi:tetratricopeptide (TPR) repeat protein